MRCWATAVVSQRTKRSRGQREMAEVSIEAQNIMPASQFWMQIQDNVHKIESFRFCLCWRVSSIWKARRKTDGQKHERTQTHTNIQEVCKNRDLWQRSTVIKQAWQETRFWQSDGRFCKKSTWTLKTVNRKDTKFQRHCSSTHNSDLLMSYIFTMFHTIVMKTIHVGLFK